MTRRAWFTLVNAAVVLAGLSLPATAAATTIAFDTVVTFTPNQEFNVTVTSGGYAFTSAHFHIVTDPASCAFGGCATNGTQYLAVDGPQLGVPVTMTQSGGGLFSLKSFSGSDMFLDGAAAALGTFHNARSINVVGHLSGGGTISVAFTLDLVAGNFQPFVFGGQWTNLTSVVWSGGVPALTDNASFGIDDIVAEPVDSSVPEPTTLLLVGTGAFVAFRRRR